jgi:hypothetical protein
LTDEYIRDDIPTRVKDELESEPPRVLDAAERERAAQDAAGAADTAIDGFGFESAGLSCCIPCGYGG